MKTDVALVAGVKPALLILTVIALFGYGYAQLDYPWQWYRIPEYLIRIHDGHISPGLLLDGLAVTVKISALSLVFTLLIGFSTAWMRLTSSPVLTGLVTVYVEIIRNTPLMIQIFVIYFVISPVMDISPFASAVSALSLFEGAYASEIIRTGILSIPKTQWEASYSLGLSSAANYRYVILPQALRQMLPMLAGQGVSLIKDSALVSTISIYDLTMRGQSIVADTFLTFEVWLTVALCYFVMTATLSFVISRWEHRLAHAG